MKEPQVKASLHCIILASGGSLATSAGLSLSASCLSHIEEHERNMPVGPEPRLDLRRPPPYLPAPTCELAFLFGSQT